MYLRGRSFPVTVEKYVHRRRVVGDHAIVVTPPPYTTCHVVSLAFRSLRFNDLEDRRHRIDHLLLHRARRGVRGRRGALLERDALERGNLVAPSCARAVDDAVPLSGVMYYIVLHYITLHDITLHYNTLSGVLVR